ncbi:hypothetical protein AB0C34_04305 [Nocardia sp. NPDC049220]|uniref:hypothetical protein n=1 Tax=Nocardia sp. NPDC049220 TaxID=3155273 RepID=UPI00340D5C3A
MSTERMRGLVGSAPAEISPPWALARTSTLRSPNSDNAGAALAALPRPRLVSSGHRPCDRLAVNWGVRIGRPDRRATVGSAAGPEKFEAERVIREEAFLGADSHVDHHANVVGDRLRAQRLEVPAMLGARGNGLRVEVRHAWQSARLRQPTGPTTASGRRTRSAPRDRTPPDPRTTPH